VCQLHPYFCKSQGQQKRSKILTWIIKKFICKSWSFCVPLGIAWRGTCAAVLPTPGDTASSFPEDMRYKWCCDQRARAPLHTVAASSNRDHPTRSLYNCLFALDVYGCHSSRTSRSCWITHSAERQRSSCNNIPFYKGPHQSCVLFVKVAPGSLRPSHPARSQHHLSAQSFTLWQQATTEITRRDHSIIACSYHGCCSSRIFR